MRLILQDIRKRFEQKEVLRGASFTFERGHIYALLGRNGAGKTTLFNLINEDLPLDGGQCRVFDNGTTRALTPEDIGYVLSTPVVPEFLTGREFLKFFLDINKKKIANKKTIDEYFEMMNIGMDDRDRLLKDYSHGMKNKMQLLVNIIYNPGILLLDEPLTSFDVVVADEMKKLFKSMREDHIIILSTHILELAVDLCDKIVILSGGTLEEIDKEQLNSAALKEKIIAALREEGHA